MIAEDGNTVDLRDLLSLLRARWIAIVAAAIAGGVVALTSSLLATPVYESRIQFYATVAAGDTAAAAYQGTLGAQQRVQSYAALVHSTDVARDVVASTGVTKEPREVAEATSAAADEDTVLLEVAARDTDPEVAFRIAHGYGDVLPEVVRELETPEDGGLPLAKLTVVNPPALPSAPVSPKTEQNVVLGVALGLLGGIGITLLVNLMDRRVKNKFQLEQLSGAPVVGSIPFRRREDKSEGAEHLVPFREGHSPAAEAFRRLRTNLRFLNVDKPPKVIVLTSSVATEGKSETAVNLSLALAEAGHSVLLVEADLRRPRVVNYMSMPDSVGLTNILSGQAKFQDVVQETRYGDVHLLACGPLPPNPSELVSSDAAIRLFEELREIYNYVIVDSPPLLPVTDGALLARIADGALLVVRENRTTTDQVNQAVDNLARANAKLLGTIAVANKPARKGTQSYYDSYYYSSKSK